MKRFLWIFVLLILLTGCAKGSREFNGEIIGYNRVDGDGELYSFQLLRQDGKEFEVFLREDTTVLSWIDTMDREAFYEGGNTGLLVNVEYKKISGCYMALSVHINGQRYENARMLADGTRIDVVEKMFGSREYCLADGTVLLYERDRVGPENMGGAPFAFDDLSRTVQEKVSAYYNAKMPYYQLEEVLEKAYDAWREGKNEFEWYSVSCDVYPSAINEKLIFFGSEIWVPGENGNEVLREGAVFDRETGEWVSSFDLFACDEQKLLDVLFELTRIQDEVLKKEIRAAMTPEKIVFNPQGIDLYFSAEELREYGMGYGTGVAYQEGIGGLMHDWAVPDGEIE